MPRPSKNTNIVGGQSSTRSETKNAELDQIQWEYVGKWVKTFFSAAVGR